MRDAIVERIGQRKAARGPADGLLQDKPLSGPYRHRESHPLVFWPHASLALLSVYDTPTGPVAFVVPADLGRRVGETAFGWAEWVATEVKALVPDVSALVLMWPVDYSQEIVRYTFQGRSYAAERRWRDIVAGEDPQSAIPGFRPNVYWGKIGKAYTQDEAPFSVQEVSERGYTYADVDAHLARLPAGRQVIDAVRQAKDIHSS